MGLITRRRRLVGQPPLFALRRISTGRTRSIEEQLEGSGLPEPETEFAFAAPARQWRFDYAWPLWKIALEIEGGTFARLIVVKQGYERRKGKSIPIKTGTCFRLGGRHNTGVGMLDDVFKYNRAAMLGWMVIRATTTMVRDGYALRQLRAAFTARGLE